MESRPCHPTPASSCREPARIAHQEEVGLSDRIYVQKFADHDATVASWLRTARRLQRGPAATGVDQLLTALDLGDVDGDSQAPKNPEDDSVIGSAVRRTGMTQLSSLALRSAVGTFRPADSLAMAKPTGSRPRWTPKPTSGSPRPWKTESSLSRPWLMGWFDAAPEWGRQQLHHHLAGIPRWAG